MKKILKHCTVIVVVLMMLGCLMNNGVSAGNDKNTSSNKLPKKFDLRDKIEIKVEDQGSRGTCWAFAALNTLETYLSLHGYGDYDFSEMHMECMLKGFIENPGEYTDELEVQDTLNKEGGHFEEFVDYCFNGKGPVLESDIPYYKDNIEMERYTEDDRELFEKADVAAYVYETKEFEIQTYDNKNDFYSDVKKHIMKNGALYASIDAAELYTLEDGNVSLSCELDEENINYDYMKPHAITIIGWDDNYDKNNFSPIYTPQNNGAYIALNSWGDSWGNNGIFYISYEDFWVNRNMRGIVSASHELDESKIIKVNIEDQDLYYKVKEDLSNTKYYGKDGDDGYNRYYEYDDKNQNLYFIQRQINDIKALGFYEMNIKTTKGLEKFTSCDEYFFYNCNITDVNMIANLGEHVKHLYLPNNDIKDLNGISKLKNLETLDLSGNKNIKDLSPLCKLDNIANLDLSDCDLTDISGLKDIRMNNLDGYAQINLYNNDINDVTPLENANIYLLNLSGNKNIEKIGNIKSLKEIYLDECNIEDLSIIENLPNLVRLSAFNNKIKNIDVLEKMKKLEACNLTGQNIVETIKLNKNKYELPSIISKAKLYDSMLDPVTIFHAMDFETIKANKSNVTISDDYSNVTFSNNQGSVTFEVIGGIADGTKYKLNYEIVEDNDKNKDKQDDSKKDNNNNSNEESKNEDQNKDDANSDVKTSNEIKENLDTNTSSNQSTTNIKKASIENNKKDEKVTTQNNNTTTTQNVQTGDNVIIYIMTAGLSSIVLGVLYVIKKRKNNAV